MFENTTLQAMLDATPGSNWDASQVEEIVLALAHLNTAAAREHADNAAAVAAGMAPGEIYHTAGTLKIVLDP